MQVAPSSSPADAAWDLDGDDGATPANPPRALAQSPPDDGAPGQAATDTLADAAAEADGSLTRQYVSFGLAGERFAVPIAPVQEIIRLPALSQLPLGPPALQGLANLRGTVLPVISLRRLFEGQDGPVDDATRVLVIDVEGQRLGFVVDRVTSVISVEPSAIESASGIASMADVAFLAGAIRCPREPALAASRDGAGEGAHASRDASDDDGREGGGGAGEQLLLAIDFSRLVAQQFSRPNSGRTAGLGGLLSAATAIGALDGPAAEGESAAAQAELRLLSFLVAAQEYALDIQRVQEVVRRPASISAVPNAPPEVLGLMLLRQQLLPLVSLRALFGLPELPWSEHQRIVVATLAGGLQVGLACDAVNAVFSVPAALADPMPGLLASDPKLAEFTRICRLDEGRRLVSLIAVDRLLRLPGLGQTLQDAQDAQGAPGPQAVAVSAAGGPEAGSAPAAGTAEDELQVVIFRLGGEEYGVPIMRVQEVLRVPEALTRVPGTPPEAAGVINLRGTVVPVLDQRARLGLPAIDRSDGQRIMVCLKAGQRTGYIVDSVADVPRIPRALISPAPRLSDESGALVRRIARLDEGRRLVLLIDEEEGSATGVTSGG